jgi:hypothetical protein
MADGLSTEQEAIIKALIDLGGGRTAAEIAEKAGLSAIVVGRKLREMEAGLNLRPVRSQVDEGRGEKVWFATDAAAGALEAST